MTRKAKPMDRSTEADLDEALGRWAETIVRVSVMSSKGSKMGVRVASKMEARARAEVLRALVLGIVTIGRPELLLPSGFDVIDQLIANAKRSKVRRARR